MGLPRFYIESLTSGLIELSGDEARHASGARRLRVGDGVELFNGLGGVAAAEITEISSRRVYLQVSEITQQIKPENLPEIAVAVPKGKRLQTMVEKLTECAIGVIQPIKFDRSVSEGGEPEKKWERWAIEACKQCRRNWLPEIRQAIKLSDFLQQTTSDLFLADISGSRPEFAPGRTSCCIIGPEGGLSEQEFTLCAAAGVRNIRLGTHILRTETAAIAYATLAGAER